MSLLMQQKQLQRGFTLIELMIAVAIIGVLAAIALPAYQDYVVKSQASTALAEISPAKAGVEIALNEGKTPSLTAGDVGFIGIASQTSFCTVAIASATQGGYTVTCTGRGGHGTKFNRKTIVLNRNGDGLWTCTSDLEDKYLPGKCS